MQYQTGHLALKNINMHIEQGAMAFIAGRSGAGKSSLLKLIALIERHNRGQIIINGQNLERVRNSRIPYYRRNIGFVFQDHRLLNDRTIFDNVALPLIIAGHGHTEIRKRVSAALDKVGLLKKANASPMTLSGGEQQRVAIARALVNSPSILFADEPTGNLDSKTGSEVLEIFKELNEKGQTIVVITHERDIAKQSHRTITIKDGEIESDSMN